MSDNYLWDRSGEPDPELQELEEILGALRYQPRSLEIPSGVQAGRRTTQGPTRRGPGRARSRGRCLAFLP